MVDTFAERLRITARRVGGQTGLAAKSGVPKSTLAKYISGESEPNVERLVALAEAAGVGVNWLATGEDEGGSVREAPRQYGVPDSCHLVPRLAVEVSTGMGRVVDDEEEVRTLAFDTRYLKKRGVRPEDARLVTARGDTMEATMSDGDTLLVDTAVHELRDDSIYCIQIGGNLRAKRLQRDSKGGVWVISDNPKYENEYLSPAEAAELHIIARVIWIGRDV